MVDRLSHEDKMLLAAIINDLRDEGPQTLSWIQSRQGGRGSQQIVDHLWALGGIRMPWLLDKIITRSVEKRERLEQRRIVQVVDLAVRSGLLTFRNDRHEEYQPTEEGRSWSEAMYRECGRSEFQDEISVMCLAVDICGALKGRKSMRMEDIRAACAPRLHPYIRKQPAFKSMHESRIASYQEALAIALKKAESEGWIENKNEAWQLTEKGRSNGVNYVEHMR